MSLGACILVRLKTLSQGVLQISRDNQDFVLFMIFRQPKIYIFIGRQRQSAFVIYPMIQYPSHTDPDLHHGVAVPPQSHSLLVRPLGLTTGKMYNVGKIYIKTPPTPPSLHAPRPLHLQSLKLQLHVVQCTIPPRPLTSPAFQASRP